MDYALEERIDNPDLFTGRKEELAYYLKKMRISYNNSSALTNRRYPDSYEEMDT
jgi:hypothetical protein